MTFETLDHETSTPLELNWTTRNVSMKTLENECLARSNWEAILIIASQAIRDKLAS